VTDRDALLQAVRDRPDDDTPRLVYADWLDEHAGGPADRARAAFIRLQIDAARLPAGDPRLPDVQAHAAALQADWAADWLAPLVELEWPDCHELEFSRGFLAQLPVITEFFDFAAIADQLLPREPVDLLSIGGPPAQLTEAAGHPGVGLVGQLSLSVRVEGREGYEPGDGDAAVEAAARVSRRVPLRFLAVTRAGLTDRAARAIATAPAFAGLRDLVLQDVLFTADGLTAFRGATFAPGVRRVEVEQRPWRWGPADRGAEVAGAFAAGGYAALERLKLVGYLLGDAGLLALTASPVARRLTSFHLAGDQNLEGPGVFALLDRRRWPRLKSLWLMPIHLAEADLARLVSADGLAGLERFMVFMQHATPDTAARLAANPHASGLTELGLTGPGLGDGGARVLMRSPHLSGLRSLTLNGPNLGEETMLGLADPATLPGLRVL
jgi:uncharacterized protein (TIGR02996 family)